MMDAPPLDRAFAIGSVGAGLASPCLVTFAVFAFNQESYVSEAVYGALSQDYSPLEVILSDDCSSDSTFEIMTEIAAAYTGPHKVIVRRSDRNLGLINHINEVAKVASADIVVVSAGDDISLPWRVSVLAAVFTADRSAKAVFSDYLERSDAHLVRNISRPESSVAKQASLVEILMNAGGVGLGATYAYHRDCFHYPHPMPISILSEDRLLPLRAGLLGRVYRVNSPLIEYRTSEVSLTQLLAQSNRLAWQSAQHWSEVLRTIELAGKRKTISKGQAFFADVAVRLRIESLSFYGGATGGPRDIIYRLMTMPLRAFRKLGFKRSLKIS